MNSRKSFVILALLLTLLFLVACGGTAAEPDMSAVETAQAQAAAAESAVENAQATAEAAMANAEASEQEIADAQAAAAEAEAAAEAAMAEVEAAAAEAEAAAAAEEEAAMAEEEAAAIPEPETILIGNPIALSGPNAAPAELSQTRGYDLWAENVNANGGIYVAAYDKRIPVEIVRYDDTSDIGTAVQLTEKLILEDEVHFLFPPWGTAFNFAIAPLVTEHQMPTFGCTVTSKQLAAEAHKFPYFFTVLNQSAEQGAGLVEIITSLGITKVAVIHHTDLHGIEFAGDVLPQLSVAGVDVALYKTFPLFTNDMSQLLREVQAADVEALIAFSYPPETILMTQQMQEIGLSPDLFFATVGVAFPVYRDIFSAEGVEGVMGAGVWNPNVPTEGSAEYFERHVEMFEAEPDRWASAACYASGQILEQAIEAAGTLDRTAVRDAIADGEFNTILGTVTFENQFNTTYPGQVGQWQNGEFEIVAPADAPGAVEPIFPKAPWPPAGG